MASLSCKSTRKYAMAARPAVTSPASPRSYGQGDIVEYCDYHGKYCLGMVQAIHSITGSKNLLTVMNLDDPENSKQFDSYFVRFHVPAKEKSTIKDSIALQTFRDQATTILNNSFCLFEQRVATQIKGAAKNPFGRENLLYEDDLGKAIFGPKPSPEEQYAVHLYLHSYNEKFARDAAYQAGPGSSVYYCRRPGDVELLASVKRMLSSDEPVCRQFREDVKFSLEAHLPIKRAPVYELFFALILKAATCNYQDFHYNPFIETTRQLLLGVAPTTSLNDLVRLVSTLKLDVRLDEADLATLQSGLCFDPARTLQHETRTTSLMARAVDDSIRLDGDTQFNDLAIAIDSERTLEVDDAISLQVIGDTTWLHVHVADASKIVPFGGEEDVGARSIVGTIYTAQATYPMLPWSVGKKASLDPNRQMNQSITFSACLDSTGNIADYRVSLGVITRLVRITYQAAENALNEGKDKIAHVLGQVRSLVDQHLGYRQRQGCLTFQMPQGRASFTKDGALDFKLEGSEPLAHGLVAECMIIAGRVAAKFAEERQLTAPYRYHLDPTLDNDDPTLHALLDRVQCRSTTTTAASLYDSLRLMAYLQPSAVDLQPRPHWAMGLHGYCKATSPLRRYGDLFLHQQIRAHLTQASCPTKGLDVLLPSIYRHEQYLKRLMLASNRFWTHRYLEAALRTEREAHQEWRPLRVTGLPIEYNARNGSLQVYIPQFALRHFGPIAGGSRLPLGVPCPMDIVSVDALRQTLHIVPAVPI